MKIALIISGIVLLAACSQRGEGNKNAASGSWTPPPQGTLVAADSIPVAEDRLNNAWFSVKLLAGGGYSGKKNEAFRYDVLARYGQAEAQGEIVMPFGGERLRPLLRRGEGYSFIMGFIPGEEFGADTSFHEYYKISVVNEYIRITALNGFAIEQ